MVSLAACVAADEKGSVHRERGITSYIYICELPILSICSGSDKSAHHQADVMRNLRLELTQQKVYAA